MARAHALGACDYVTKGTSRDDLVRVVSAAARGESPIEVGLLYNIAATLESKKGAGDDVALTNRESQVLRHIALGLSNREMQTPWASALKPSKSTGRIFCGKSESLTAPKLPFGRSAEIWSKAKGVFKRHPARGWAVS